MDRLEPLEAHLAEEGRGDVAEDVPEVVYVAVALEGPRLVRRRDETRVDGRPVGRVEGAVVHEAGVGAAEAPVGHAVHRGKEAGRGEARRRAGVEHVGRGAGEAAREERERRAGGRVGDEGYQVCAGGVAESEKC